LEEISQFVGRYGRLLRSRYQEHVCVARLEVTFCCQGNTWLRDVSLEFMPWRVQGARIMPIDAIEARHEEVAREQDIVLYCA